MVRASKDKERQGTNLALKRDDIIASKGNGLIILLHGGPRTGKTLTAGEFRVNLTDVVLTRSAERCVVFSPVCSGFYHLLSLVN